MMSGCWALLTTLGLTLVTTGLALAQEQPPPCSGGEAAGGELCAFRALLENTIRRVDDAMMAPSAGDAEKRKSSYVRFGRSNAEAEGPMQQQEKRKSSYVRFGRSDPSGEYDLEKRKSALVRFGRADQPQADKRKSSYIRFG